MDCLSFSFNKELPLPIPCLAFSRLRDEGVAFPCEADICGMMTTLVMQEISQKPSYFCNVASVDNEKSRTVLRHCVAPLQLLGRDADPLALPNPGLPWDGQGGHSGGLLSFRHGCRELYQGAP